MRRMHVLAAIAASGALLVGAQERPVQAPAAPAAAAAAPMAQMTSQPWLNEIVRHLYRWYIDERDIDAVVASGEIVFWTRPLTVKLDEGDRSRFGEVVLPQFSLVVKVKQADYAIPELDTTVRNADFRITDVARLDPPLARHEGATEIRANYQELRDELFKTRLQAAFPEGELLDRLRAAVRAELAKSLGTKAGDPPAAEQVVHLAPLSPIANEAWVFWETGRKLIRFASDIDLANPAVWEHEQLAVKLFDIDRKVVVSLDEVAGSNAFMTRDEAGRALFNCIVLGKRIELTPGQPAAGQGR